MPIAHLYPARRLWHYALMSEVDSVMTITRIGMTAAMVLRDALGRGIGVQGVCRRNLLYLDWCGTVPRGGRSRG